MVEFQCSNRPTKMCPKKQDANKWEYANICEWNIWSIIASKINKRNNKSKTIKGKKRKRKKGESRKLSKEKKTIKKVRFNFFRILHKFCGFEAICDGIIIFARNIWIHWAFSPSSYFTPMSRLRTIHLNTFRLSFLVETEIVP